ncbi:hypothetical protein RhiirA5_446850 [Rhizophagus irregularis]|nr:hypothetical protein RhiirA5_446850 [Rhizophagus irregularis]
MNYINDEISPHTEEILNDTQIINLVQNEEVILFYEQQPIDNSCKMEDLKRFRYYASDLKFRYINSLQQKSIDNYFSYS